MRRSRTVSDPPHPARASTRVVVIGNGMAGHRLVERLATGPARQRVGITVVGEEPVPAYDRVHLTRLLGGAAVDDLLLAPPDWHARHGVELRTGDPVAALDRPGRRVVTASGVAIPYDHAVFATGSRAHVPDIPGRDLPGVFVYRTATDLHRIRTAALKGGRVAVLGGGLLGLEAAHALHLLGPETWVVERGTGLLARQLDPEGSRRLQTHVERLGVHVITGRETITIEPHGDELLLTFQTGECLRVRTVVLAAGIRPRDELAAAAGLQLGPRGGIAVDDLLRTSDPDLFAVGECAAHQGNLCGLAGPSLLMAEALASTLAGRPRRFPGADPSTWLKLAGLSVATLGDHQHADGESLVARTDSSHVLLVLVDGRLAGAVGIGDWPEQARVHDAIRRRRRLWPWEQARFRRHGRIWSARSAPPVAEWPESALVCNCLGIRRGTLSTACREGCTTVDQLARTTGASTLCGSCRPLLAELVGAPADAGPVPGTRGLLIAAVLAAAVAAALLLLPPIPLSDSVQDPGALDVLWRNGTARRITGFTVLGLTVASLLLSARKRIARFQAGPVGTWKAVHAALGLASLVGLVTHTGLRMGDNLNRILLLNFLALAVAGALAGTVTALERRLAGPAARRLRAAWTLVHIVLAWPLPVLLGFHILAAFYY